MTKHINAPLEKEIRAVCDAMAEFLIEKNKAYGNSAAQPAGIFAKRLDNLAQIDVRIDDKLNRLQKGHEYPGDDTVKDLCGYLLLRMVVQDIKKPRVMSQDTVSQIPVSPEEDEQMELYAAPCYVKSES